MKMIPTYLFNGIVFALSVHLPIIIGLSCLNQVGKSVDWFVVYKLPNVSTKPMSSNKKLYGYGELFYYMDADAPQWTMSLEPITSTNQSVGYTLQQIYSGAKDLLYAFYNDENPYSNKSTTHGHTKGALGSDDKSGFWMVLSVPKFPNYRNQGYLYQKGELKFGQTFLCISLPLKEFNTVGYLLQYNYPQIYDSNMPSSLAASLPNLTKALNTKKPCPTSPPWSTVQSLLSVGNAEFQAFAKCDKFNADLYDSLVAPNLQTSLQVETWHEELNSSCSTDFKVYNVRRVQLDIHQFDSGDDHAKWAVGLNQSYTCIGDINRAPSQMRRGGGTVCLKHAQLNSAFSKSVVAFDDCRQ